MSDTTIDRDLPDDERDANDSKTELPNTTERKEPGFSHGGTGEVPDPRGSRSTALPQHEDLGDV